MKAIWFRLKFLFLLLCLIPLVTACLFFPDTTHTTVVEGHNQIVSVKAPVSALDRGATIAVEPAPVHNTSGTVTPIGNPIQIKLSSGDLHGQATITFTYPQHLPTGITPNDLMVTEYSPVVNVWLPVPSTLDLKNRQLIVTTNQFSIPQSTTGAAEEIPVAGFAFHPTLPAKKGFLSKAWQVVSTNLSTLKDIGDFAKDIAKDAIENHGDFLAGFLKRMLPSPPKVECEKTSHRLLTNVIDSLSPGVDTVCVQDTKEQDVVELKLANTHVYPVWVSLPKGVEFEPHAQEIEYDHFEELMMQFVSISIHDQGFLLRGDHVSVLKVHLSQLPAGARIITHVEPVTLVSDMVVWLIDMVAGGKVTKWADQYEFLKNTAEIKEAFDTLTGCIGKGVGAMQGKYDDPSKTEGKTGRKNILLDVLKLIGSCAIPSAKAMYTIWSKIAGVVKDDAEEINPLSLMITRFKFLYENPGMIDEWMEGLIAWLTPDNAGKVYIDLSVNHNLLEDVDWTQIPPNLDTELGCNGPSAPNLGVLVDVKQFADITGDGEAEAFVAVACVGSTESWPDRLEVFDGASDSTNPRLIATLLDYNNASDSESYYGPKSVNLRIDSITVSGKTVIVKSYGWWAATDYFACKTMQVTDTFTWNSNGFTRGPRSALHLICPS